MPMHQGIDLSRFRKVSSDGKTTTLRHSKGHEVKIAHGSLSPKMRDTINQMPAYLADGEEVPEKIKEEDPQENSGGAETTSPEVLDAQESQASSPAVDQQPQSQVPGQTQEQSVATAGQSPDAQQQTPQNQQDAMSGPHPLATISPQEKMAEHMNYATDMANGDIKPETYHSLFGKQDTLGKIGTIFGLLVSGMGSGLTHQPNMVMEMMNKEIERDIQKQKENIENHRSFMSLQYQHNLQQAQIAEHKMNVLGKQVDLAPKAATAGKVLDYMNKSGASPFLNNYIKQANNVWSDFEGAAKTYETVGDHLEKVTQNNPQANAVVNNVIKPAIQKKVADLHNQGTQAVHAATKDLIRSPAVDPNLSNIVHSAPMNPNDIPAINDETQKAETTRNTAYDFYNAFNVLKDLPFAGQTPGLTAGASVLGGLAGTLTGGVAHASGDAKEYFERARSEQVKPLVDELFRGGMSKDQAEELAESILPHFSDNPKTMRMAFDKGMQRFRGMYNSNSPTLRRYNQIYPGYFKEFPNLPYVTPKVSSKGGNSRPSDEVQQPESKAAPSSNSGERSGMQKLMDALGIVYKPPQ